MGEETVNKRTRQGKTTRQQYSIYLKELRLNESFRTHKFNVADQDILEESWDSLTKKLNCCGGPQRTIIQWKKNFTDWKCSVRKKARLIKKSTKETGGGPPEKPLNDLEETIVDLTGKVVVEGLQNVEEMGSSISDQEPDRSNCTSNNPKTSKNQINKHEVNSIHTETQTNADQNTSNKLSLKHKNHSLQETIGSSVKKRKEEVLLGSVKQLVDKRKNEDSVLKEINENLKVLVELKHQECFLLRAKLQLKYNVSFETEEQK